MAFNLEKMTLDNKNYREVVYTTTKQQLVIMSIEESIDKEIHEDTDQFIRIEEGTVEVILEDIYFYTLNSGDSITISSGTYHEVINKGSAPAKLYTIYSPPHHPHGLVQVHK